MSTDTSLAGRVLEGDPRSVARAISMIENEAPSAADLIRQLHPHTGRAYLVGITGPPGAGKSTLVDRLTTEIRRRGQTVGIVAVDPTSPFTGGAILGDRVRMGAHAADGGVFIRSMATRGHLGGLARATGDASLVLDAAGKDVVIIETVGVGQDEVEIVRTADVSVVLLVPGTGDDIQALKAGLMEIADVFVVNKADRDGADQLVQAIGTSLALRSWDRDEWRPPVLTTVATEGAGVPEVWEAILGFQKHAARPRQDRRRMREEYRLRDILSRQLMERVADAVPEEELQRIVDGIVARATDPYSASREILARVIDRPGEAGNIPTPVAGAADRQEPA